MGFYKHTIKLCVNHFWRCLWISAARMRAPEGRRVSSKCPLRIQDPRHGSFWVEWKRTIYPPSRGVIDLPSEKFDYFLPEGNKEMLWWPNPGNIRRQPLFRIRLQSPATKWRRSLWSIILWTVFSIKPIRRWQQSLSKFYSPINVSVSQKKIKIRKDWFKQIKIWWANIHFKQ